MAEFDIHPKRSLGQNFLVDDNILGMILQRLEPRPGDVALEVGAGLGVLTRALAGYVRLVHAFEMDAALEPALRETVADTNNVFVHVEDILRARLEELSPPPTVCASNLPYSVAGPFLAEALGRLPRIRLYCVMVQREVADRIAAPPGNREYGSLSAWVQLHAEIRERRALSRNIFYPRPRVDSTLLVLSRRSESVPPGVRSRTIRAVMDGAFSQRRKTLENSLAAAFGAEKGEVRRAIELADLSPRTRAEQVSPVEFARLADTLADTLCDG